jgi:hypothetical protein
MIAVHPAHHSSPGLDFVRLLEVVRGEFLEMPGLRLTRQQARRLWALDADTCDAVLSTLEGSGFLRRTREGKYMLAFPRA